MYLIFNRLMAGIRVMWTDCTAHDKHALWSVRGQVYSFQLISLPTETNKHFNHWMRDCIMTIDISVNGTELEHVL